MGFFSKKKKDDTSVKTDVDAIVEKKVTDKDDRVHGEYTVQKEKKAKKKKVAPKKKKDSVQSITGAYGTIVSPIVTEKAHAMATNNTYTFRVSKNATKKRVKNVIEEMYKVTVTRVNMVVVKPKRRTIKYDRGYQKLYKKAIVTVRDGDHITIFDVV